jgi:hypothetical protein
MHSINFFPVGNADCFRIDLGPGRQVLFDYADMRNAADSTDKRIDLPTVLRKDLEDRKRDYYDVVVFTHLDNDHCCGAGDFFHLDHASKYQGDGRIKMKELWVPAAAITEGGCEDDARVIRAEARHRLRAGTGIRVFSSPDDLKGWLEEEGLTLESRKSLITQAGSVVPGFQKATDGVEFFAHSPMASRRANGSALNRNLDALVLHATFQVDGIETKALLTSDITHEVITSIVEMTRYYGNEDRLEWDLVDVPHHCSYKAIGPEKGTEKTDPVDAVKWLYEDKALAGARLISPSCPIPAADTDQPPHRQAANYYRDRGEFLVTMEHPTVDAPETLVITIDHLKATVKKKAVGGAASAYRQSAPRAGRAG